MLVAVEGYYYYYYCGVSDYDGVDNVGNVGVARLQRERNGHGSVDLVERMLCVTERKVRDECVRLVVVEMMAVVAVAVAVDDEERSEGGSCCWERKDWRTSVVVERGGCTIAVLKMSHSPSAFFSLYCSSRSVA